MAIEDQAFLGAGQTNGVSITLPATDDQAGYEALTFTNIAGITDPGNIGGTAPIATANPLDTDAVVKGVGQFDYGSPTMMMLLLPGDAGQDLLKELYDGANKRAAAAFERVYADGSKRYFKARVASFEDQGTDANSFQMVSVQLAVTGRVLPVAAP
jgi:protein-disulfide isomerase